ncbi:carbamoyltransferase N-terminal domain-containing protein, partial [Mycoplasmopsis synoviae]|uniref:carbamoyltransferase N-terminal domain-containing protein n=1 Tax=Mycoplasmopsis synoviae TaxID=2109 RepID=UPI00349EA268
VAFVEEERLNRDVHTKRFPHQAIASVLRQGGVDINDVDAVAFAHKPAIDFARSASDAVRRVAPKRLGVQAFVDARLAARERTFRNHWSYKGPV